MVPEVEVPVVEEDAAALLDHFLHLSTSCSMLVIKREMVGKERYGKNFMRKV